MFVCLNHTSVVNLFLVLISLDLWPVETPSSSVMYPFVRASFFMITFLFPGTTNYSRFIVHFMSVTYVCVHFLKNPLFLFGCLETKFGCSWVLLSLLQGHLSRQK